MRTAAQLAPILIGEPADKVLENLADRSNGFAYLARKSEARDGARVRKLEIEGIGVLDDTRRYYPQKTLAAQVLGSVGVDNKGLLGLEQQLDDDLHGSDGKQRIEADARGDAGVARPDRRTTAPGKDLRLTLDVRAPGPRRAGAGRGRSASTARRARPRS